MRTLLICHHDAPLDHDSMARWLASFSTLAGIVVITEPADQVKRRIRRELKRSGAFGLADVLAFRALYRMKYASADRQWEQEERARLAGKYAPATAPIFNATLPNAPQVREFIADARPDIVIARCKSLLKPDIFLIPTRGTFVLHPGICPEYRNAHGCFWALARRDVDRVGATLLRIDEGIDTGPVFGYYGYDYDERNETHHRIQQRCVFDNLDAIAVKLREIVKGTATPIDVTGRASAIWGQPRLSAWLSWQRGIGRNKA